MRRRTATSRRISRHTIAGFLPAVVLLSATAGHAGVITVNTTADEVTVNGNCSLREAVLTANADAQFDGCAAAGALGNDTIELPAGTYDLSTVAAEIEINDLTNAADDLVIIGDGAATTIIQANAAPEVATYRVLEVREGSLRLEDLTIRNGGGSNNGAGVYFHPANDNFFEIDGCVFEDNQTASDGGGFLVASSRHPIAITDSVFRRNRAEGSGSAGGAGAVNGANGTTVAITDCLIEDNFAQGSGGGFKLGQSISSATIERVRFLDNSTIGTGADGGALVIQTDIVTITECTFDNNHARSEGGALRIGTGTLSTTISGSTFSNNSAFSTSGADGGAIRESASDMVIVNSTFYGNSATDSGGAIHKNGAGSMVLNNVTIVGNTADADSSGNGDGGGIRRQNGPIFVSNSIIADNFDLSPINKAPDCSTANAATVTSQGYNLIGVGNLGTCTTFVDGVNGDQVGTSGTPEDPMLTAPAINGGLTETMLPSPGSPVLDGGNPATPFDGVLDGALRRCLSPDQRGVARPIDVTCDIGATEGTGLGVCGDGNLDAGEECESPFGECCNSSTCLFESDGSVCRFGSGDVCDPDELCTGSSATCPSDEIADNLTLCNEGSGDLCDPDELCTGVALEPCPADSFDDGSTVCNEGSGDLCDPDELCTGIADEACPVDDVADGSTVCNEGSGDLCDPDELCTGVADQACPSDTIADSSTVCRVALDDCDIDETCTGVENAACPADAFAAEDTPCSDDENGCTSGLCDGSGLCESENNELPCDDGLYCTVGDTCTGGVCVGQPRDCSDNNDCTTDGCTEDGDGSCTQVPNDDPCSDGNGCTLVDACAGGVCVGSSPVDCDDDDVCTVDSCNPGNGQCINAGQPRVDCHEFGVTKFVASDPGNTGAQARMKWRWSRGTPTAVAEFGDPLNSTDYTLCVYDRSGGNSTLETRLEIPAGPPWKQTGTHGFKRKDKAGSNDGVTKLVLHANKRDKGDVVLKAGYCRLCSPTAPMALPFPVPFSGSQLFAVDPAVSLQLVSSDDECWISEFTTAKPNTASKFVARAKQ